MKLEDAIHLIRNGRPRHNDRLPLPAGHSVTWGAITRGTLLEGEPYPHPVFEGLEALRWTHRS